MASDPVRESRYTWAGLLFLIISAAVVARHFARIFGELARLGEARPLVEEVVFVLIVSYLFWASALYFVCRLGYLTRCRSHRPVPREALEAVYDAGPAAPPLTVLIPSYREEEQIVRQALLSAALMEYPDRRIVLLIDDPPAPADAASAAALRAVRELPRQIERLLGGRSAPFERELRAYEQRQRRGAVDRAMETQRLAALYAAAAAFLERLAGDTPIVNHTDALFVERVLREPARAHQERGHALAEAGLADAPATAAILREYRRLASLFAARVTSFERKRFINLSHTANKAMNLNSYLGLIGGAFREVPRAGGLHLERCDPALAHLRVAPADYVVTVDADSLLLHDYALRLTHVMAQPRFADCGVVQTPYTAVPARPGALERAAGAQTDHQWIMSQGLTRYGAAFWIGASAVLRYRALADIREITYERGYPVARYVRDGTLTEDSESTVALVSRGWKVHNYLDRLSYSATPPDFGALVVQRRRWANGGLLILPALVRGLRRHGRRPIAEAVLRGHYLASTAAGTLCVLALLVYPFGDAYTTSYAFGPWLPMMSAPYFLLVARDLASQGYGWRDLLRIHALTLLLVPVNLAGTVQSMHQAWTGRCPAFARTPKVTGRTAASPLHILMPLALLVWTSVRTIFELGLGHWGHAPFVLAGALALAYACACFVGTPSIREDLLAGTRLGGLTPLAAEGDKA